VREREVATNLIDMSDGEEKQTCSRLCGAYLKRENVVVMVMSSAKKDIEGDNCTSSKHTHTDTFKLEIVRNGNQSEQRMFDSINLILSANVVLCCTTKTKRSFISQLSRESFAAFTVASRYP
jgi:hypothetical protein